MTDTGTDTGTDARARQVQVGLTRDAGWELGVRRTVPTPPEEVWRHLVGAGGPTWLGVEPVPTARGQRWTAPDGATGEVRTCTPQRRLRLTWRAPGWSHDSTLQLTVIPAAGGTTIAVHQERLADAGERAELLEHWTGVLRRLVADLS